MRNLSATLHNTDPALLPILAQRWGVNIQNMNAAESIKALCDAMLDTERTERVWDGLDDTQRGALQTLLGSGGKMTTAMFTRLFGQIRKMGAGAIEREKPHQHPASIAEALYYRGLIAEAFEQAAAGVRGIIYVAPDLAAALPVHKTGYTAEALEAAMPGSEGGAVVPASLEPLEEVEGVRPADTTIVDDLTTLLAYIQLHAPALEGESLQEAAMETVEAFILTPDAGKLEFMLGLGISADLIEIQEGRAYTRRAEVRRWLSEKRAEQLRTLAEAWRGSRTLVDLWRVPGLHVEPAGWDYDPVVARAAVLEFMNEHAPKTAWWSLDEFIILLKEVNPDFQRPGDDYESWYIRNDAGEYLTGFESWDAVEGALLEYYLMGPMHWLGLVDLAEDAARLTVYGRAFLGSAPWPAPQETDEKIRIEADGTLFASRRVSRLDRFQMARFTTWQEAGDPYIYKLDSAGIQRAADQGINTGHIAAFLRRMLDETPLPPATARLLSTWEAGPAASVSIEKVLVLRTTALETLDAIWNAPALRRYLGARLGPMAAVVRADQWEALRDALGAQGIEVEIYGT